MKKDQNSTYYNPKGSILSIINRLASKLYLKMYGSLFQSATRIIFGKKPTINTLIQTRNKMKTHKAAAKRFIKTGNGFKRKQAGRNHGNGGFSANSIRQLDSFVPVTDKGGHLKKLKNSL